MKTLVLLLLTAAIVAGCSNTGPDHSTTVVDKQSAKMKDK